MGRIGFGDDEQPACVLVDPVDDAGPDHAVDRRKPSGAAVQQGVDQRAGFVPRRRVDHHPLGFVDDEKAFVLIDDLDRDILRPGLQRFRFWNHDADFLAAFEPAVFYCGPPVNQHRPRLAELLYGRAAQFCFSRDKLIDPDAVLRRSQKVFHYAFPSGFSSAFGPACFCLPSITSA